MNIGQRIKQLRIKNNLTLEELASRCELTKGFLSQLERDLTSPSISTLNDIVEALGMSLSQFFQEENRRKSYLHKKISSLMKKKGLRSLGSCLTLRKTKWNPFCWKFNPVKVLSH
jgi:transcriptional regulator with XRE-family HTH domain